MLFYLAHKPKSYIQNNYRQYNLPPNSTGINSNSVFINTEKKRTIKLEILFCFPGGKINIPAILNINGN